VAFDSGVVMAAKRSRTLVLVLAAALAATCWVAAAFAAPLTNGGFETGSLAGWTSSVAGASAGFAVYTGTPTVNGHVVAAPPEGTNAVVTSQSSPGQALLYQDVTLPSSGTITISLYVYYESSAALTSLADLSFAGAANQQFRVDVMDPLAPVASLAGSDIFVNVFKTSLGDPTTLAPTLVTADLSAFAGQTVRLRLAEADNQGQFQASADGIAITSVAPAPVPVARVSRVGYCTAAGAFIDLEQGQPAADSHYTGAVPAIFVQGKGITCDPPPAGYTKQGKASPALDVPAGVYDYWAKP
jgi:hypothetical protein